MSNDGRLGNLLEVWTPWWFNQTHNIVIDDDSKEKTAQPNIVADIPNMSSLIKSKPSFEMKYNVVNVLYCYVFVSRLHNGDHVAMATESTQDIMDLSMVLGQGYSCGSVDEAIQLCLQKFIGPNNYIETTSEFNFAMIKDVEKIIGGKVTTGTSNPLHSVLCAMSDVYYMFKAAHKDSVKVAKKVEGSKRKEKALEQKKRLFGCVKKCEFLLSWCQTYGMALVGLAPELEMVYTLLVTEYEAMSQNKKSLETQWNGQIRPRKKKLIEEL